MTMTTYDFSPLFRSTVGFDRLARLAEAAMRMDQGGQSYPPYNIDRSDDDHYRISIAVAGFAEDELSIEVKENELTVTGRKAERAEAPSYLYRGIATRDFLRRFQLADHVRVDGAALDAGMLHIDLIREVPEEAKPRRVEISRGKPAALVDKAKKLLAGDDRQAA
jgi:molecular chaperone IbpA